MAERTDHYSLVRTAEPAVEPLDLTADVKPWLRIDAGDTGQDTALTMLVAAARQRCERVTGRSLVTQTWRLCLDRFAGWPLDAWAPDAYLLGTDRDPRCIRLPRPPCVGITLLAYTDTAGVVQTLGPTGYQLDADSEPARLLPAFANIWPVSRIMPRAVQITYTAGYGSTAASVPAEIRMALLHHVAYSFRERESADEGFLDSLFAPFVSWGFAL